MQSLRACVLLFSGRLTLTVPTCLFPGHTQIVSGKKQNKLAYYHIYLSEKMISCKTFVKGVNCNKRWKANPDALMRFL